MQLPTAKQPKIAMNYIESVEWEEVAYSRTVDGLGLAQLDADGDEHVVYPDVTSAGVYDKVRVKVETGRSRSRRHARHRSSGVVRSGQHPRQCPRYGTDQ